ncbi:hypothetical protein SAMN02799630_05894 [Paenibacillus sp. UNCCL117]|nr:hypothetical protein SAMN04488602_13514 [Paenibacillus sp. cl123]SFW69473.1 hypothetical protein SAMN02799630_05894 [Paenibacillus sp. UNCCL117]
MDMRDQWDSMHTFLYKPCLAAKQEIRAQQRIHTAQAQNGFASGGITHGGRRQTDGGAAAVGR